MILLLLALVCPVNDPVCKAAEAYSQQSQKCALKITQAKNAYSTWATIAILRSHVLDLTGATQKTEREYAEAFLLRLEEAEKCIQKEPKLLQKVGQEFRRRLIP